MSETDSLSPPPSPSRPTPGAGDGDRDGGEQRRKQVKKADRLPPALLAPAGSLPLEDRFEWAAGQVMATAAMGTDAPPAPARRDPTVLALMDTYNHEDWMPDEETDKCLKCHREFTVTFRRHHCRNCGLVFCAQCTPHFITLLDKGYSDAVRVCEACHNEMTDYLQAKYGSDDI